MFDPEMFLFSLNGTPPGRTIERESPACWLAQLTIPVGLLRIERFESTVAVTLRYTRVFSALNFHTDMVRVALTNEGAVPVPSYTMLLQCDSLSQIIPSQLVPPGETLFLHYPLRGTPYTICTINGLFAELDMTQLDWLPNVSYVVDDCDTIFHRKLADGCFSGCANDTRFNELLHVCVHSCAHFFAAENRCLT